MRQGAKRAGLFAASLATFLCAAEIPLRHALPDGYYVWPPNLQRVFRPDPEVIHGVTSPSQLTINAFGMRGEPLEGDYLYHVLAVGGSTTICVYLDDAKAWPFLLQERLNTVLGPRAVWVGNVGRPGHTTRQHVLQVEKLAQKHREIDAVVLMIGVNDLLIYLGLHADPSALRSARPADPHEELARAFSVFPGWEAEGPWYLSSAFGRLWQLRSWRPVENAPAMDPEAAFLKRLREYRRRAASERRTLPDLREALSSYGQAVHRIVDVAEREGVRIIFLTQPTLWRPGLSAAERDLLWGGGPPLDRAGPGARYYSVEGLAEGMQRYNEALLEVCRQRGVECLDAAAALPRDTGVFYDDAHLTEKGSSLLADRLAAFLLEREPLRSMQREERR
jgi:lysophospholipase L1-like esterase